LKVRSFDIFSKLIAASYTAATVKKLFQELAKTQPETRKFYRKRYFSDGRTLMWEYRRQSPAGDQQDFVEVMEIEDGLIKRHCVYWGWFGVRVLERGEHFKKKAEKQAA